LGKEIIGTELEGGALPLATVAAVAVAAAAVGRAQVAAELGCLSSTYSLLASPWSLTSTSAAAVALPSSRASVVSGAVSRRPPMGGRALAMLGPASCQVFCKIARECVNSFR